jgi:formylglycine-generating enzyme required for sulfatase activity
MITIRKCVFKFFAFCILFLTACSSPTSTTGETQTVDSIPQDQNTPFTPTLFNPHPDPSDYIDAFNVPMRSVPAGEFIMGSTSSEIWTSHTVYLDEFRIDKFEVTNILYKACVSTGDCTPPQDGSSDTHRFYYNDAEFDHYPVIHVSWDQANSYCIWRGASLPTEAQWEKAARGIDERSYPWGEEEIDCDKANYQHQDDAGGSNYCSGDTAEVGSYEGGISPYGLYDMAGNVWEWTADWYSETYYQDSPASNPLGPDSGTQRVIRDGGWDVYGRELLVYKRSAVDPDNTKAYNGGFRCASGVNH